MPRLITKFLGVKLQLVTIKITNLLLPLLVVFCSFSFNSYASSGLLGSVEFQASSLKSLPKWTNVLERIKYQEELFEICKIDEARCESKAYIKWNKFIDENKYRNLSIQEKLHMVNNFANEWPYKTDMEVWNVSDYWASPAEFLKFSGDCEDYAITKFVSLKKLGVDPQILRVVVVQDTIRNIAHAVLSVTINEEHHILDSLINMVMPDKSLKHYIPQYSVNDTTRWAHIMPRYVRKPNDKKLIDEKTDIEMLLLRSYGE